MGNISGLSYIGVVHIGLSWGYLQFTQDGGALGDVIQRMNDKNSSLSQEVFGSNYEELLVLTSKSGSSGLSTWNSLSKEEKDNYKSQSIEIRSNRVQKIATIKN